MRYQWRPLDKTRYEIRLLDLDAGVGKSPLHGQLQNIVLDPREKPRYETVSYTWGDTALIASISVGDGIIFIPGSAASALRCMRLPNMHRTLWIDCICIDQNDDREKGHQVGLMADIFRMSDMNLAFLGDDAVDTAKRAFDGLAALYDALKPSAGPISDLYALRKVVPRYWRTLDENIDLMAIRDLLQKPYFK